MMPKNQTNTSISRNNDSLGFRRQKMHSARKRAAADSTLKKRKPAPILLSDQQQGMYIKALEPLFTEEGTLSWLYRKNNGLDGFTPAEVIQRGDSKRVMDMIDELVGVDMPYL